MIVVAAKFRVSDEDREAALALCRGMLEPSRAERGCLAYSLYEDATEHGAFLFYEEWADRNAIEAHFASPHFLAFMEAFPAHIHGEARIDIHEVRGTETR